MSEDLLENARPSAHAVRTPEPDLDEYASYEDGDALVVCDRANPRAWIKSDVVTSLKP